MRIDSGELKARLLSNPDAITAIEELEDQARRLGEQETVDMALTFGYSQERVVGQIKLSDPDLVRALVDEGRYELARVITRKYGRGSHENQLIGLSLVPMMASPAVADVGWGAHSLKGRYEEAMAHFDEVNQKAEAALESGGPESPTATPHQTPATIGDAMAYAYEGKLARDTRNDARDLSEWMGTDEEVAARHTKPTDEKKPWKWQADQPNPFDEIIQAYVREKIEAENEELEAWLTECIMLSDFEHIDDIFIACLPDGSRVVQSWWRKPEWLA